MAGAFLVSDFGLLVMMLRAFSRDLPCCGDRTHCKKQKTRYFCNFFAIRVSFSSPLGGNRPQYGQLPAFLCRDSRLESLEQLLIAKKLQSGPIFCFWAPGAA